MVLGEPLDEEGTTTSNSKCSRCEAEITLNHIEDCFGVISKAKTLRTEVVSYLNKYIKQRKNTNKPIHLDTCLRKAHFFAQVGVETLGIDPDWIVEGNINHSVKSAKAAFGDRAERLEAKGLLEAYCKDRPQERLYNYMYAKENGFGNGNGNEASGDGYKYRGRGLKQLTGKTNYKNASETLKEIFPEEYIDLEAHPEKVEELKYTVLTAIAFWEKHEIWKEADKAKSTEDLDELFKNVRRKVVGPSVFHWREAKAYFLKTSKTFKTPECQKENITEAVIVNAKDIVTYRIYSDGRIEKHIPKVIKEEYKQKYKYVYHDATGNEHNICVVDWHIAQNWIKGSKKIDDGGVWVKKGDKKEGYRYYLKGEGTVELIKVLVPINYNKNGVIIKIGDNTEREYMNPISFASLLGAVAECGYLDFNFNGSASEDGTGWPSLTHVNGISFDFRYLRKDKSGYNLYINEHPDDLDVYREEKFIDALIRFGYSKFYSVNINLNGKSFILKNSTPKVDHQHHLHSRREGYNPNFKEIKE